MSHDSLGDRMKLYENSFRHYLPRRMPVVIRVDGTHFHSYTKGCAKPFDKGLVETMDLTALYLCKNIQNAVFAYVQSDEISILLVNFKELDTQSWFDNNLQKMVSVAASMASVIFSMNSYKIWEPKEIDPSADPASPCDFNEPAFFDARAFILPKEEVNNYFVWRQQDATRNSVQMLARSLYSHKECTDKNNSDLQEMIFAKGQNWNDLPTSQKRGRCIVKSKELKSSYNPLTGLMVEAPRSDWTVSNEIPVFSQDKEFVNSYLEVK